MDSYFALGPDGKLIGAPAHKPVPVANPLANFRYQPDPQPTRPPGWKRRRADWLEDNKDIPLLRSEMSQAVVEVIRDHGVLPMREIEVVTAVAKFLGYRKRAEREQIKRDAFKRIAILRKAGLLERVGRHSVNITRDDTEFRRKQAEYAASCARLAAQMTPPNI